MNKTVEFLLIALSLCGMYSAIPKSTTLDSDQAKAAVIVADGSDPMPICRAKGCSPIAVK